MKINYILVIIFVILVCLCIYYVFNNTNITNISNITNNLNGNNIKNNFYNTQKNIVFGEIKFKNEDNLRYEITNENINKLHNLKKYISDIIIEKSKKTSDYSVYLYEDNEFKGKKLELKPSPNIYNLTEYELDDNSTWNDKVSSLDIPPFTRVTLYQHINKRGDNREHVNNTDKVKKINMDELGLENDILSSVKIDLLYIPENLTIYENYILKLSVIDGNNNETENIFFSGNNILDDKLVNKLIKKSNKIEIIDGLSTNNSIIKNNSIILHIQKKDDIKSNKKYIILPEGEYKYKFNNTQFIKILNKFNIPTSNYSIKKVEVNNNYFNNFEFLINSQIINPNEEILKPIPIDINNNTNFEIISRHKTNSSQNDSYVVLYAEKNFGGDQKIFNVGSHNLGDTLTLKENDYYSSIKLFGDVKVTLFQHKDYKGKKLQVFESISDLDKYGFNNFLSSLKVKNINENLYLVKQIKFEEYIDNPFKYVISQGLFKNYEAINKKEILENITTTFDLNKKNIDFDDPFILNLNKENIDFDDPFIINLFSNKSNFYPVIYKKKYEFDIVNINIDNDNNNILNLTKNYENDKNNIKLEMREFTNNNVETNIDLFKKSKFYLTINHNYFNENNIAIVWNKSNNFFKYLNIDIQNSNSNRNIKYNDGIEYLYLPKNIGVVEYLKEKDGNIQNEFLRLQNINNIKTVNNNENYKIIDYRDNKLISFRLVNTENNNNKKFVNYKQLCPDKCISEELNNEKSGNLFSLKTDNKTNIKYGFENEESKDIYNSSIFSVCQGYLDKKNNCSSVFDSEGQNKIDCRTCRMPIKHLNNNVDITCPDACFNTESTDNLVINTDNKGNGVCTRYAVINERNNDTKKYYCSDSNKSIDKNDKIYVDCRKCTIKKMNDVKDSRMKESFTNTNTNTNNTQQIIATIHTGENKEYFTFIKENYFDKNKLYTFSKDMVHYIYNNSSNKLLGIYSSSSNEVFPQEFNNKYPYNLFTDTEKPNIILGPGDNLSFNDNDEIIIVYNSRTAQNEQKPFNKDFRLVKGNISKIKLINEPEDCYNFTSSYSDCINKLDRNGNNCRFIYANQLNDDENTSNFLKNRTRVEEENNYYPLQQELSLYKTADKKGDSNYGNVNEVYNAKRIKNQNFCFSINPEDSNDFPLNGACSTSNYHDKIKFPCVRINEKDSNGNITKKFVRHRNAKINELGIQIRKFVFNEPGAKIQNLRTLQRIFEVNDIIKSEVEAEELIQKELLKSNQNRLNKIHNNLMNEINNNNLHNIEGFTINNRKPIQRIQSNYTNQNLTVIPNEDNSFSMKINDNCLSVYNDNEYSEVKCNKNSQAQKFVQNKIMNASDEKILMGKTQISNEPTYPYSIFKSKVSGNCLNMDEDGVSVIPCNPNSERQKWAPFADQNICLDSR